MTLSKRAFKIILPVIMAGNIAIAVAIYWIESSRIFQAETARQAWNLERLRSSFTKDLEFARGLVFLLQTGDAIGAFVREKDTSFRTKAIGAKVQDGIEYFSGDTNDFVSFAIMQDDLSLEYYFEKSDDPFATISPVQRQAAHRLRASTTLAQDEFVFKGNNPILIHTELVDRTTFSRAFRAERNSAVILQSAVAPANFLKLKSQVEQFYGVPVLLGQHLGAGEEVNLITDSLLPNLNIGLRLPRSYLNSYLCPLALSLIIGCVAASLISIGLLVHLMRRTITDPISKLDAQVTGILLGARHTLDKLPGHGVEVERLASNFKTLHDQTLQALAEVRSVSLTDSLTGISNRLHFSVVSEQFLAIARQRGLSLSFLFIDIDNFKFVNDTFGHAVGDMVLKRFTECVICELQSFNNDKSAETTHFARLSGDEFAVLFLENGDTAIARKLAFAIAERFKSGMDLEHEVVPVTVSVGISSFPSDAENINQLTSCADKAMYHAKASGKSKIAVYSDEIADNERRRELIVGELQKAVPDAEFSLVYMPIVSPSGDVLRLEALLRWNSPLLGPVSPAEFVPFAETSSLFTKIDRWVIRKAVSDFPALASRYGSEFKLSINLSAANLGSSAIVDLAIETVAAFGVPAASIEFEITETFASKAPTVAVSVLGELRSAGFGLSLDDFGSGYTSIKQIFEFPLDCVKIDRELARRVFDDNGLHTIMAIVNLCHSQGCLVVAEGIEDDAMLAALEFAGCDLFQGFAIQKPLPLADLLAKPVQMPIKHTLPLVGAKPARLPSAMVFG